MSEEATVVTAEQGQETKTYTQEEVDKLIQSEADKRVSQAMKTAEKKNAEKIREASKLAAMNESEKFQYELEQREKAIIEKENALALAENKNVASQILAEKGLSLALVDFVVDTEADVMDAKIKALDKAFKASVKAEVEKRLGSSSPKKNLLGEDAINRETFKKMSLAQQNELFKTDPNLYKSLLK